MQRIKSHLIADIQIDDIAESLSEWSWLLCDAWSPLLVSAVGDVFLIGSTGAVARLDTGVASLEQVAETLDEFKKAVDDPAIAAEWFLEPVVNELQSRGKRLRPGQ